MNYAENVILPGDTGERFNTPGQFAVLNPGNIWTPHRERQVRDLRAMRGAVERHRRRRPLGPPLCSTTFGGNTIPPLFGGGGGFAQGDIRIASVGSAYVGPAGGNPAPVTLPSAGATVGDELWQIVHSSGTYTNPTNWVQRVGGAAVLFNRFRLFSREADGIDDDFVLPINTLFVTAQQWSLNEVLPFDTWPSLLVQGGFLNDTATTEWTVSFPPGQPVSMAATATGDPAKFAYGLFACQDRKQPDVSQPSIQNSPPVPMETIVSLAAFAATAPNAVDTELTLIQFDYKAVSIQYDSYIIGRTPGAPATYAHWCQHERYRIF